MAKCCPRTCGRLATAAIFISVGVVQVIAGIILLRSEYSYMLCGPNFWTALSNIAVGILLGIASTVWKTINKNSTRHANRRKLLAALVSSLLILNATTAAMLIIGDGQKLLAIYLEKGGTLEKEILAYAYTSSVCSPIVCIVVSITFLTGICFRQKAKDIKALDFKNIYNEDSQMYDWVYTSNLPKPDPEILKTAFSSESESDSSGSESDSSSNLPVPLHLRSRSSLDDIKNSQHGSLQNRSLPFSATRNKSIESSVYSDFNKTNSIPRLSHSSLIKTPVCSHDGSTISYDNGCSARRLTPGMVAYRSGSKPGTPVRIGPSIALEKSNKSGTPVRIVDSSSILENSRLGTPIKIDASRSRFEDSNRLGTPIRIDASRSRFEDSNGLGKPIRIGASSNIPEESNRLGKPLRIIASSSFPEESSRLDKPIRIEASSSILEEFNRLGKPIRIGAQRSVLEESNNLGTPLRIKTISLLEKSACSPNFQFNSSFSPNPKVKLSFSTISQDTPHRSHLIKQGKVMAKNEHSVSGQSSMEDSTEGEDSFQEVSKISSKAIGYSPKPHSKICRTSTTDHTKVQKELENLDNSAIQFNGGVNAFKEIYLDDSLPEVIDKERLSNLLTDSGTFEERNDSLRSGGDLSVIVRNSNFRKKLSSRLVPATGPVISENHSFYKTSNRKSRKGRMKPYSKSKEGYDAYLQTGFSSFKDKEQIDEVDTTKQNSSVNRSLMTSISEIPTEEESDSFLPSTSTHSSGYMSVSYEESDDESKVKPNFNPVPMRQQVSPAQKLIAEEIRERHRRRTDRVSFKLDNDR